MAHPSSFINIAALIISLALIAISIASIYLTAHGVQIMDEHSPAGKYWWYRGPSDDMDTKHQVQLNYNSLSENFIYGAGAVSILAGLMGVVGVFTMWKVAQPALKSSLVFLIGPGGLASLITLITLILTSVVYNTNNHGSCYWENGYTPNNTFSCTRELASCNIAKYFRGIELWHIPQVCGATQTGRHLVIPLFLVSVALLGLSVAQAVIRKRAAGGPVEDAEDRVARLQRDEEE